MEKEKEGVLVKQPSEVFMNVVMKSFNTGNIELKPTEKQKELIQGYFIAVDKTLATSEEKRISKNAMNSDHSYDNTLPYIWNNVNLKQLALDVMHYSKMGLDVQQKNMIHIIPYKNNRTGKYDINLMEGYNGIKFKAERYALNKPKNIVIELVYKTDEFRLIKKDAKHLYEGYEFQITQPFDRGEVVGGFGYYEFDDPSKNRVVFMTIKDILKRKPEKASAEFWGGTKTEWKGNKKTEVQTDGWYEEMCLKTLKRFVYSEANIPLDPTRIDESYEYMKKREMEIARCETEAEIQQNANKEAIVVEVTEKQTVHEIPQNVYKDTISGEMANVDSGEVIKEPVQQEKTQPKQAAMDLGPNW